MLPSKKKQIVEVQANAAAIINQKVDANKDIESASNAVIRPEPELRLALSEVGRQAVEARRKALVVAEKTTAITKSPSP